MTDVDNTDKREEQHTETELQQPESRGQLLWDVLVFQFKLFMDGLRDVILVPVSLVAALLGLISGGNPARFYHKVLLFGRRTEAWINLFGHDRRNPTADDMIRPLQKQVFKHASENPRLKKAGESINRSLDSVGEAINPPARRTDSADTDSRN